MNHADYKNLLDEVMDEISSPAELRCIAGISLCAADRLHSSLTKIAFQNREIDENE